MTLSDSREAHKPLLSPEDTTSHAYHPPRRRTTRCLILIFPSLLFLLTLLLGATYSQQESLQPLQDRIQSYINGNGRFEEEAERGVEQEVREWSKEDRQLRKYRWTTPEPHESLRRALEALNPVESRFPNPFLKTLRKRADLLLLSACRVRIRREIGSSRPDREVWELLELVWELQILRK